MITIDIGGTSSDICLIKDGKPNLTTESDIEGYPIKLPMIDVNTIGAGGGSIAWIDPGGALRVGPQSAGADPGPACYGLRGKRTHRYRCQRGFRPHQPILPVRQRNVALSGKGPEAMKEGRLLGIDLVKAAEGIITGRQCQHGSRHSPGVGRERL